MRVGMLSNFFMEEGNLMGRQMSLIEGKVAPSLLKFTMPILISMLLQTAYGTADLLIVGQFSSVGDVSGVTIGSQIMQTITSFCAGFSTATTILLGQYIGAKLKDKTSKLIGTSIFLFSVLVVFISLFLVVFRLDIAQIMQTPKEAIDKTTDYLMITGLGTVFIVFYNLLGSIFRGIGDSKTPLFAVSVACVINIILDLVFVAGFSMGATGAALATVIAQAVSVLISLFVITKRDLPFEFYKKDIKYSKEDAKNIVKVGVPIALQSVLVSVSFLFVTAIINDFGVITSAAVGIVEKITVIVMMVPISFMQSLSVFTAQNFGAKREDRMREGLKVGILLSLSFSVVMTYLSVFHGEIFTSIFTSDPMITSDALMYLKAYSIDIFLVAFLFSFTGYFNGCGRTGFVMFQAVFGAFLIRIPLAYFFKSLANTSLFLIGLATPASTFVQIIMFITYYIYTKNKGIVKKEEINL